MVVENILFSLITSLENLQALNKKDRATIHNLVGEATLQTCARQLAIMSEELKDYEGKYTIGMMTPIGPITMVKKNQSGKITLVRITNKDGDHMMTIEELEQAVKQVTLIDAIQR